MHQGARRAALHDSSSSSSRPSRTIATTRHYRCPPINRPSRTLLGRQTIMIGATCNNNNADGGARRRGASTSTIAAAAAATPGAATTTTAVVGCGSCGVDYLAAVAAFPKPDEKLRTETLEAQGGGNAANALTAASRLGLAARLVTKIGGDGLADGIVAELARDGVGSSQVLRASPGVASPFTYIIVDRSGGTRTCIHTPLAEPLRPEELSAGVVAAALEGGEGERPPSSSSSSSPPTVPASVAYFDGRMADAAIRLAHAARAKNIPVLVEGERPRPGLDDLLGQADVVCTSAHFPREWTGKQTTGGGVAALLGRLPHARVIVTTLGALGAVMVVRETAEEEQQALLLRPSSSGDDDDGGAVAFLPTTAAAESQQPRSLDDLIEELKTLAVARTAELRASSHPAVLAGCDATGGVRVCAPVVAATRGAVPLLAPAGLSAEEAEAAAASASRAAAMNADAGNARAYADSKGGAGVAVAEGGVVRATVLFAPAAQLAPEHVVDTTGAGDAFIGSVVYSLAQGLPAHRALRLAAVVAAAKCTALGARPGLPWRDAVDGALL